MQSDDLNPQIRPIPRYELRRYEEERLFEDDASRKDDIRLFLSVIYKYRTLVLALTFFSSIAALVYALTCTPLYSAKATLQISTYQPVLTGTDMEEALRQSSRDQEYMGTRIEEVKSFAVADRVLSRDNIKSKLFKESSEKGGFLGLFRSSKKEQPDTVASTQYQNSVKDIQSYIRKVSVAPVRRTSLVQLGVTSPSPVLSSEIANAHADVYTNWVRENRIQRQSEGLKFLRSQAEDLKVKIARLERELADYAEEHSIVALNKDQNITVSKMAELSTKLTAATENRIEAEKLYEEAQRAIEGEGGAGFDDPSLQASRALLAQLEAEYGNLLQKFTPEYPKARQLKAQIDQLQISIDSGRKQVVLGLKSKALAAKETEKRLQEELDKQKSEAFELSKSEVEYNILNRELMSSRELLETLLRQIKETALAVQSNASNVSILDYATPPLFASFPNKKLIVVIGLMLGLGGGICLAFLLNHLDNTVRTAEELTQTAQVANLGLVPAFEIEQQNRRPMLTLTSGKASTDDKGTAAPDTSENAEVPATKMSPDESAPTLPIAFLQGPKSLSAEAYRTIRTALLLSKAGESPKTILVTSGLPGEGKTTTASNLAATLASQDKRVLLIDADMRKPSAWRYFEIDPDSRGLADVLTGHCVLDEVIQKTSAKEISFLASGPPAPNPAELLGSRKMAELIEQLGKRFDHIIIDSPPVLPVTDAVILSKLVDGVTLVVKGSSTPKKVVQDAVHRLRNVGATIFGTILNSVDLKKGGDYYYNHYYARYYEEEEKLSTGTA